MKSSIALIAVVSAFCLAPAYAQAEDRTLNSRTVSFADLDLRNINDQSSEITRFFYFVCMAFTAARVFLT